MALKVVLITIMIEITCIHLLIQTFLESEVNTIGILIVCNAHISIWNIIDCLLKLLFQLIILSLICIRLNTFNLFI